MEITFIIFATLCAIALVRITGLLYKRHVFHKAIDKIPGSKAYPIIGTLLELRGVSREDRFQWFANKARGYKDGIFRTWLGEIANVHLTKPRQIATVLPSTTLITKSIAYTHIKPWLGTGLLTSTGEKWHHHRKMITPAFHFNVLEQFAVVMSEKAEILKECIGKELEENPGMPVDIFVLLTRCALDIICESAMGTNINAQREAQNEYSQAIHSIANLTLQRLFRPWLQWDWLFYKSAIGKEFKHKVELSKKFTIQVIRERKLARCIQKQENRENRNNDDFGNINNKRKAFLDLLLDASECNEMPLSDEELREEVDTFMFAGHDTTATGISWALFCLGNSVDVQEKVHQELDEVFGDSTKPATRTQLARLKYLERVIKETLRMYPSAPSVSRTMTEDTIIDGYVIPTGAIVSIHIREVHRDPESWPDPDRFDPDRFLRENSEGRHPYAYIPFSAGPRNCIGQKYAMLEEKIILTAVLRRWKVRSVLKHDEVKCYSEFILRPQGGLKVYFETK